MIALMLLNLFRLLLAFCVIGVIVSQTVKKNLSLSIEKPFQERETKTTTDNQETERDLNPLTWLLIAAFLVITFLNTSF